MKYVPNISMLALTFVVIILISKCYFTAEVTHKNFKEEINDKYLLIKNKKIGFNTLNTNDTNNNFSNSNYPEKETFENNPEDYKDYRAPIILDCNNTCENQTSEIQGIINSALPMIKTIMNPTEKLYNINPNKNNSEYYQGSLILQIPEKSHEKLFFNVFNNFIFNNSSILQLMQGLEKGQISEKSNNVPVANNNQKKQESLQKTIKSIENVYKDQIKKINEENDEKIKKLKNNLDSEEKEFKKNIEEQLKNVNKINGEKLEALKEKFIEKIKNLKNENEEEKKLIIEKNKEIKKLKELLLQKVKEFDEEMKKLKENSEEEKKKIEEDLKKKYENLNKISEEEKKKLQENLKKEVENEAKIEEEKKKQKEKFEEEGKMQKLKEEKEKLEFEQKEKKAKEEKEKLEKELSEKEKIEKKAKEEKEKLENEIKEKEKKLKEEPKLEHVKIKSTEEEIKHEKVFVPVKLVDNIQNIKPIENKNPPVTTISSNKKPEEFPPLFCMDINGEDIKHFQMNYEKCKELNAIYMKFVMYLTGEMQNTEISCDSYDCKYEVLVKFKDDKTEISINESVNGKMLLRKIGITTPSITKIHGMDIYKMEKNLMKDFVTSYLYNPLITILKSLMFTAKYDLIFISDGDSFEIMDEDTKNKFKKSLLSLQNIDDRFIIEWSNIRIISKNEKKIKEYLMLKNSKNGEYNNVISLNLSDNGVSIIGDDAKKSNQNQPNSDNIEGLFNNNEDKSKTSLEISKGGAIENIYSKNVNLRSYSPIRNSQKLPSSIENIVQYPQYIEKYYSSDRNREDFIQTDYLTFNEKLSRILKDPVILKLEQYIKNFNNNSFEADKSEENQNKLKQNKEILENEENFLELEKKNQDKYSINALKNKYLKIKGKNENSIDNNGKNVPYNDFFPRFKENNSITYKMEENYLNNTRKNFNFLKKNENGLNLVENNRIRDLVLNHIKFCFNKGYLSKEFNITGDGNFYKCYHLVNELNKNNVAALKKIEKLHNLLKDLKYDDQEIDLERYLEDKKSYRILEEKSNKISPWKVNLIKESENHTIINNTKDDHHYAHGHKISLGVEFSDFKFLFYTQETQTHSLNKNQEIFRFEEITKFENLKNKTINICSKSYPDLKSYLSKFNIKKISNICLDSTFFIFYLEKLGIKDSSYLIVKAHKINQRRKDEQKLNNLNIKIFLNFLKKENNFYIFLTFCCSILIMVLFKNLRKIIKKKMINLFIRIDENNDRKKYEDSEDPNAYYKGLLEFYKVKNCLLYKENALLKEKYGKDFDPDYISDESLIEDLKYFLKNSQELNDTIEEVKVHIAELKYNVLEILLTVFSYAILIASYGLLNYRIYLSLGFFSLILVNLLFFINIIFTYLIKKTYSFYFSKKEMAFLNK